MNNDIICNIVFIKTTIKIILTLRFQLLSDHFFRQNMRRKENFKPKNTEIVYILLYFHHQYDN